MEVNGLSRLGDSRSGLASGFAWHLVLVFPAVPNDCILWRRFLADGSDVMFNKFHLNVASSAPDNSSQHSNSTSSSDRDCVVAANGQWKLSNCDERHGVVCQSDQQLPGFCSQTLLQSVVRRPRCGLSLPLLYQLVKYVPLFCIL